MCQEDKEGKGVRVATVRWFHRGHLAPHPATMLHSHAPNGTPSGVTMLIRLQSHTLRVGEPYGPGHCLTPAEARVLNEARAGALRRSIEQRARECESIEALEALVAAADAAFSFGIKPVDLESARHAVRDSWPEASPAQIEEAALRRAAAQRQAADEALAELF